MTQLSIFLKLKPIVKKLNLVVEIGFKTVCADFLWLEISDFFKKLFKTARTTVNLTK